MTWSTACGCGDSRIPTGNEQPTGSRRSRRGGRVRRCARPARPARAAAERARRRGSASRPAPPRRVVVLKPDHVRDVDLFVRWYGARAFGPLAVLARRRPEDRARADPARRRAARRPAGARRRPRRCMETPVYLPEQRALVFADAHDRAATACCACGRRRGTRSARCRRCARCSTLPFEHVIVSHGEPVHTARGLRGRARARVPYSRARGRLSSRRNRASSHGT